MYTDQAQKLHGARSAEEVRVGVYWCQQENRGVCTGRSDPNRMAALAEVRVGNVRVGGTGRWTLQQERAPCAQMN